MQTGLDRFIFKLVLVALLIYAGDAFSIPVFARKYNLTCFACHAGMPTLNEFGKRFKANGYQIPTTIERTPIWDSNQLPIAIMAHASYEDALVKNKTAEVVDDIEPFQEEKSRGFVNTGIDVLSGGTLGSHFSYFVGVPVEDGEAIVEQAFLEATNLLSSPVTWLNIKVGKFFLDTPFAANLRIPGATDQVFFLAPVEDGFAIGEPQLGISVAGLATTVADGLGYEVGIFNGSNIENDNNTHQDFYARISQAVNIRNAPLRGAFFIYTGKQPVGESDSSFNRVGFDVEFYDPWTERVYVYGQYMHGKDDDTDAIEPGDQTFEFNGGFIGTNVVVLPEQLILFAKYDRVNVSKQWDLDPDVIAVFGNEKTVSSVDFGVRYFFLANAALQADFIYQWNTIGYPVNGAARVIEEDSRVFAAGFDFDF